MREHLGAIADDVDVTLQGLADAGVVPRIWEGDHTVWQQDPTEVADRLGWLESPGEMSTRVDELTALVDAARRDGMTSVVLAGMGGSSLFALVMAEVFAAREPDALQLHVLDSTDPAAIRRARNIAPLDETLVVSASKSGTTLETRSHLSYFWEEARALPDRGRHFLAITDPGSPLADLGREREFRHVFENRPDIGGRFSALSYFGLVPAAFAGVDVAGLLARAGHVANACSPDAPAPDNPGARLGAILAAAAQAGRDKLTLLLPEEIGTFGAWIEQLVAESTGKDGTGILPVVDEPIARSSRVPSADVYGDDRLFVSFGPLPDVDALVGAGHPVVELDVADPLDIGGQVFLWEFATAVAGAVLGINPFDQPDVAAAKDATAEVLTRGLPDTAPEPLDPLLDRVEPGDYLAILAYVDPQAPVVAALQQARLALGERLGVATTLGVGPRYLHSTGQLHKGGPDSGVFLLVVSEDPDDIAIPGEPHGFSLLKQAQAAGDLRALRQRGRRVARVAIKDLLAAVGATGV